MRLINVDELMKRMCNDECYVGKCELRCYVWHLMNDAPTVDAVEVVRCKDCIYWYREYGENKCLEFADVPLEPNDFCSHGERREDGKTDNC